MPGYVKSMFNTRVSMFLLSVIAISMFCASCATNVTDSAGKINGKMITKDEFFSSYRGHYAIFSYQNGRSPDSDEKLKIFNDTWTNISRAVILRDYFTKYKIAANLREVLDTLSTNIPEHIITSPRFLVNGKFDRKLYLQSLTTDRPENLSALRKQYQEFLIPIQKLKTKLIENELISTDDNKRIAQILAGKADLELHIFDSSNLEIVISDSEIASYYQTNLNSYRLQPFLQLDYCMIPVIPDDVDFQNARAIADSVYIQLEKGSTAESLISSASGSIISYLDSGYIKTSELPQDVSLLLASLSDGQSSSPQKIEKGWVIYQKVQSTKTLTQYRSIFVQSLPRSSSLVTPETTAKRLMNLALSIGLPNAADEFDLPLFSIPAQHPDSLKLPAKDLGKAARRIRSASSGSIIEPLYSTELSAWIVFEVKENQDKEFIPISEAKDSITQILSLRLRSEHNQRRVQAWLASPQSMASDKQLIINDCNYNSASIDLPLSKIYYLALSAHLQKQAAPIVDDGGQLIVPVVKKWTPGQAKVTQQQIRTAYTAALNVTWFDNWLDDKIKQAKLIKYINP